MKYFDLRIIAAGAVWFVIWMFSQRKNRNNG